MAATTIRTNGGELLDDICFKFYKGRKNAVQDVLKANPGLSKKGPVLPANLNIVLPELAPAKKEIVKLWD